ncbi:hypothetical protein IB286_11205 [Spongiibacter sp. KMU-158]|uniref:Uncharacterized protein n=1 Tax=Spongiibacter pelagi TaxID=2760804 RepID=A0A927C1J7_9GAMM|nr:hypothetical protein [Spongiibacter pelagi]MBD2859573.1 hypothetical protein [Spongiibacter pelagi]
MNINQQNATSPSTLSPNMVKNLCSRKLLDMLKNSEWQNDVERLAIESELYGRKHYIEELHQLKASETLH